MAEHYSKTEDSSPILCVNAPTTKQTIPQHIQVPIHQLTQEYLQIDPYDVPIRANRAMQLLWGDQEDQLQEALKIVQDLIGYEHQNVKTLMREIVLNSQKFKFISKQELTILLNQISEVYNLNHDVNVHLFNQYQKSELHEMSFKFTKKQTFLAIQQKQIPIIPISLIDHLVMEYNLYKTIDKCINFMSSILIVTFNMQLLRSINEDIEFDLCELSTILTTDPQSIICYLFTLVSVLVEKQYESQAIKVLEELKRFKGRFNTINNEDSKMIVQNVNNLIILRPKQQINSLVFELLEHINQKLWVKYALTFDIFIELKQIDRKVAVSGLIQALLSRQDQDYLNNNINQLYELICHVQSKNIVRSYCNFLETIHLLSFTYNIESILPKLSEYFQIKTESVDQLLLQIYQQLEHKAQSYQYISLIAKLLYQIFQQAQKLRNQNDVSFHYYTTTMKYLNKFLEFIKLPLAIPQKLIRQKSLIINLTLIERFAELYSINSSSIKRLKLSLMQGESPPLLILLQLSSTQEELNQLKQDYPHTTPKELKFQTKLEEHKLYKKGMPLKAIPSKPTLAQFLKLIHRTSSYIKYNQVPTVTKLIIFEQLLANLTASIFTSLPKYTNELFEKTDIGIFRIEHKELARFYTGDCKVFTPWMFYNQKADALISFQRLCNQIIKQLSRLGFYKAMSRTLPNLELFMYRSLSMSVLLGLYSRAPWYLDFVSWSTLTDLVSSCATALNPSRCIGEQHSEQTRQSIYRSRKSHYKIRDTYNKLLQCFDDRNILKNYFYKKFSQFTLEYLCIQNHSQSYFYDKLVIQRRLKFNLRSNCEVVRNLFSWSDPTQYPHKVVTSVIHDYCIDKCLVWQIIPTLVLGVNNEELTQPLVNYCSQLLQFVQQILSQALNNDIELTKLYFYLMLRLQDYISDEVAELSEHQNCHCTRKQMYYDKDKFQFDLVASMASYQMSQKRILRQLEDLSIYSLQNINRQHELPSIMDIQIKRDIIVICLFEFNGEKTILISKYDYIHDVCQNRQIKSLNRCLAFKDALFYYLRVIQENIDCMNDIQHSKSVWWQKREYYEQQLQKRQTSIESALSDHLNFIYNSHKPLLLLSPQLQLLPWDHIRSTIFNRVLSLGHIIDLINLPIDSKQDMFYVLNPNCDLQKTEDALLPMLKGNNIKGLIREKPTSQQIIECLQSKLYYMYIGHGGGELYFNEKQVLNTHQFFSGRPYLLGCSSAQMIDLERFKSSNVSTQEIILNYMDWHGLAVSYLLRGCPTLFGALWPITDKDADKYAIDLISQYADLHTLNPEEAIQRTKPKCALKQFNGTAFVIYGINNTDS